MAIGKKIEVLLPHIVGLEESLDSCPSDGAELERRDRLIRYAMTHPPMLNSKSLLAGSGASRDNFRGSWSFISLPIASKTRKRYSDSSKIFKSQSSTIRFAHDPALFSTLTRVADGAKHVG